ncbi:MAG: hypothetical protein A3D92_20375 [Bacteroidetes bacterium RIFCSPHIGHO2_02_FULL_44_7]|nr:MAG: hypothetical protein A3D92_20375 [Bacteroidetes bacterium RIFCSPHIGHO2_02_FULL_44_7]
MMGAFFNIKTVVYMGVEDIARQKLNVLKMKLYGATVRPVEIRAGVGSLKDAINEDHTQIMWSKFMNRGILMM